MKLSELKKYKKILILGYGTEGKVTETFLRKYHPEAEIGIADQAEGPNYLKKQKEYDLVIKSPGVPLRLITQKHTTATNIFFHNIQGTIIGITGSKGKSTTTTIVYNILKAAGKPAKCVGNIGKPMLAELLRKNSKTMIYVCELSSFQTEDLTKSPDIAVILNLFPDHMDHHGSVARYYRAKKNIIKHATKKTIFIYNPKISALRNLADHTRARSIPVIDRAPFTFTTKLMGQHNTQNIMAAITVAKYLRIANTAIRHAIQNTQPLPHRIQQVGIYRGVTFYDDAIATTPESTIIAIETLKNVQTILLGGKNRGYHFAKLARAIKKYRINNIVLFPESGVLIKQSIKQSGFTPDHILETRSMAQAVRFCYRYTPHGAIALLSTASPSYTLLKNFEEKGNEFQKFVQLQSGKKSK